MLVAALSVVFHGAFAVIAHPLQAQAHHNCIGHGKVVVAEQSLHGSRGSHHDNQLPAPGPAGGDYANHHGKLKDSNSCCSAVSAAVLPPGYTGGMTEVTPARLSAVLTVMGDGEAPPTPAKPPRQTYLS